MTPSVQRCNSWIGVKLTSIFAVNSPASYSMDKERNCGTVCAELQRGGSKSPGPELKEKRVIEACHALPEGNNRVINKQTRVFS